MNKIIKNISMLTLVAFTLAACGGGGGGAGTAIQPSASDAPSTQEQVDNTPGTWSSWTLGTPTGGGFTSSASNVYGEYADIGKNVPAATENTIWNAIVNGSSTEEFVTQTGTKTITVGAYSYTRMRTVTQINPTAARIRIDTRTCSNGNCDGEPTRTVVLNQASDNSVTLTPSVANGGILNVNVAESSITEADSRQVANPAYDSGTDTAVWSGWTLGTPTGGDITKTVTSYGTFAGTDPMLGYPQTNTVWDPIVSGPSTQQFVTQNGVQTTTTGYYSYWKTRTNQINTHTSAVTRLDTRVCNYHQVGLADNPLPTCSGSETRTITITAESDVAGTATEQQNNEVQPTSVSIDVDRQVTNPAWNPADEANWGEWTLGTETGGVTGSPVTSTSMEWSPTTAPASQMSIDQTKGTITTVTTSAVTRIDSRICNITNHGPVDNPAVNCTVDADGNSESRTVIITPESSVVTSASEERTILNPAYSGDIDAQFNGSAASGPEPSNADTVSEGTDDAFYITNTGTGTKNTSIPGNHTSALNGYAETTLAGNYIYTSGKFAQDTLDAYADGWSGEGISIKYNIGTQHSAPNFASNADWSTWGNNYSCVIKGNYVTSCNSADGLEIGAGKELSNISHRSNGSIDVSGYGRVAAGVSLVWGKFDTLNDDQIQDLIEETADTVGTVNVINLSKALSPVGNLN